VLLLLYRNARDHERAYLSEAGCGAFDEVRRLYIMKRIQMMDASICQLPEHVISEADLVVDVCSVLIGLPSRSFNWSSDDNSLVGFSLTILMVGVLLHHSVCCLSVTHVLCLSGTS